MATPNTIHLSPTNLDEDVEKKRKTNVEQSDVKWRYIKKKFKKTTNLDYGE